MPASYFVRLVVLFYAIFGYLNISPGRDLEGNSKKPARTMANAFSRGCLKCRIRCDGSDKRTDTEESPTGDSGAAGVDLGAERGPRLKLKFSSS